MDQPFVMLGGIGVPGAKQNGKNGHHHRYVKGRIAKQRGVGHVGGCRSRH